MRWSGKRAGAAALRSVLVSGLLLTALWPQGASAAAEPDVVEVTVEPGGGVRATARVTFPARPALIQALLTDYPHWPELFDVRMRMVDVAIREGVATTDVRIEHALMPGERRLVTESRSLPEGGMVTELVGGDFRRYRRVWKLTAANGGRQTRADFELVVAIDSVVPDWLVALAMRRELEAHFRIVKEKARARATSEK